MYSSILLAIDGSKNSLRATEEACKIASETAMVTIIYVVDYAQSKNDVLHAQGKSEIELARRQKILSAEEFLQTENISYKVQVVHGDPGPTIVEFANNNLFDILIIGSRGLNAFQEMVLGSVSHKVVKGAKCPVLVVK
ncbi:universal stress protein [Bacillus sp. B1-b2]|uniref:universal stress protein n=1 Tax=Bacillus sp. B1-b2 TaxID=2653201 RepID=UPI001262A1BA|nr:universal stress protein [Bacillus sp. B1-b2]KAB7668851.1 universal stress protein [Bacillus sp. B1-b2]